MELSLLKKSEFSYVWIKLERMQWSFLYRGESNQGNNLLKMATGK
jgi:hypothetical protein